LATEADDCRRHRTHTGLVEPEPLGLRSQAPERSPAAMTMDHNASQSKASIAANASYFLKNIEEYEKHVRTIDTYRRIHHFLTEAVADADTLLDIGNGGVFPYDTSGVGRITALDLFLGSLPAELLRSHFPPNAQAKEGSALSIPEPDRSFDMALMVMLLHHL